MGNPFHIEKDDTNGISVLRLNGFLDAHTAPEFEAAIQGEVEKENYRIIVECSHLTYISSAGLGVFMGFVEDIRESGGDIKICGLEPKVFQVFELLGFHQLFHIEEDLDRAVQKFTDSPVWEG